MSDPQKGKKSPWLVFVAAMIGAVVAAPIIGAIVAEALGKLSVK